MIKEIYGHDTHKKILLHQEMPGCLQMIICCVSVPVPHEALFCLETMNSELAPLHSLVTSASYNFPLIKKSHWNIPIRQNVNTRFPKCYLFVMHMQLTGLQHICFRHLSQALITFVISSQLYCE